MGNLTDHFSGGGGGSNILEKLIWHPKGQTITTTQGAFTSGNITTHQDFTTSTMTNVNGTDFSYTPPDGTTSVFIRFEYAVRKNGSSGQQLGSVVIQVDGTEVDDSRTQWFHNTTVYKVDRKSVEAVIDINGTESIASGSMNTWNSAKVIRLRAGVYSSAYGIRMHRLDYWLGGNTDVFVRPTITIVALK